MIQDEKIERRIAEKKKFTYSARFLWREDTGASRLSDFLYLIPVFLLLQGLVRLALAGIVLDWFLQAARTACVHRGRLLISLLFSLTCDFYLSLFFLFCVFYPDRLAAVGVTICQFALAHLIML